jgi:hypothetical protein
LEVIGEFGDVRGCGGTIETTVSRHCCELRCKRPVSSETYCFLIGKEEIIELIFHEEIVIKRGLSGFSVVEERIAINNHKLKSGL